MSRWRDRNVGRSERLLPITINYLLDHRYIDPKVVSTLVGFRAQWEYCSLAEKAFETCASKQEREVVLNHILHYIRLEEPSMSVWERLKDRVAEYQLNIPDVEQIIEFAKHVEISKQKFNNSHNYDINSSHEEKDWDRVFNALALHTLNGISTAYTNFKSSGPPYYHERFFAELFSRVSIGKETELVRLFPDLAIFELYHFRSFLEQIPDAWKSRMAIKSALADVTKRIISRYCMEISKNRYYQQLPLQTASELSGILELDLIDVVLTSIGEANEIVGSGRLFTLVGLLVGKLSNNEALEALNFSLDLFEAVLDENDGDGAWVPDLMPPTDINEALAGCIWAALAAPEAKLRWEAAHVVRGLCTLSGQAVLVHLVAMARNNSGGSFTDARFHFYHLHARQWLMIAFARAVLDSPEALVPYADFFIHYALNDEPHVIIQHFAAKTALSIATSGRIKVDANMTDQLTSVNRSPYPVMSSKRYERHKQHVHPMYREPESKRFSFDYDMSRYWFENLGDCFAVSASSIESEAEKVICDDWLLSENGHWDRDERTRRRYFRDDESYHSHGSYPRFDNLNFYLSYHAMMVVAGNLLKTVPIHQDPEDTDDEFNDWLNRHSLSRRDGNWLADRRDPTPREWQNWKDENQDDNWRWSVCKTDFDRALGINEDRLNLWGQWNWISGYSKENIHIASALVSSDRSTSLLRALQTTTNPHDYCIPEAGNRLEIDELDFQLKGWVENPNSENRLDEFDPWAGDIRFPPIMPAKFVRDFLQLESDIEYRVWRYQSEGTSKEVLWSQIWGCFRSKDDESESESGRRLQVSPAFIREFLGKIHMDLIVEVNIERQKIRYRYESYSDDGLGFVPPYSRIFIMKANGESYAI